MTTTPDGTVALSAPPGRQLAALRGALGCGRRAPAALSTRPPPASPRLKRAGARRPPARLYVSVSAKSRDLMTSSLARPDTH